MKYRITTIIFFSIVICFNASASQANLGQKPSAASNSSVLFRSAEAQDALTTTPTNGKSSLPAYLLGALTLSLLTLSRKRTKK